MKACNLMSVEHQIQMLKSLVILTVWILQQQKIKKNEASEWLWRMFRKGALTWYGELTWQSAHAWNLIKLCYYIVWGMTFTFTVHLSFYAISLLIYDVMNDITIIPQRFYSAILPPYMGAFPIQKCPLFPNFMYFSIYFPNFNDIFSQMLMKRQLPKIPNKITVP